MIEDPPHGWLLKPPLLPTGRLNFRSDQAAYGVANLAGEAKVGQDHSFLGHGHFFRASIASYRIHCMEELHENDPMYRSKLLIWR